MEQTNISETSHDKSLDILDEADTIPEVVIAMVSKMTGTAQSVFWYQYLVAAGLAMTVKTMNLAA